MTPAKRRARAKPAQLRLKPRQRHRVRLDRSIHAGRVLAELRDAIISGALLPGTLLIEARIAQDLEVSRGPVRRALHVLESEGLVESLPNGRMTVVGMSDDDLDDLLRVRFELESLAVRLGLERGADTTVIREAFLRMELERAPTPHLVELDMEFHRALIDFSGSRALQRSWDMMAALIETVIRIGTAGYPLDDPSSEFRKILDVHRPLVEAIEAGDAAGAAAQLAEQSLVTARSTFREVRDRVTRSNEQPEA